MSLPISYSLIISIHNHGEFIYNLLDDKLLSIKNFYEDCSYAYGARGTILLEYNPGKALLVAYRRSDLKYLYCIEFRSAHICSTSPQHLMLINKNNPSQIYVYDCVTGALLKIIAGRIPDNLRHPLLKIDKLYPREVANNLQYYLTYKSLKLNQLSDYPSYIDLLDLAEKIYVTTIPYCFLNSETETIPLCSIYDYQDSLFSMNSKYFLLLTSQSNKLVVYNCTKGIKIWEVDLSEFDKYKFNVKPALHISTLGRIFLYHYAQLYFVDIEQRRLEVIKDHDDFSPTLQVKTRILNLIPSMTSVAGIRVEIEISDDTRNFYKTIEKDLSIRVGEIMIDRKVKKSFKIIPDNNARLVIPFAKLAKLLPVILVLKKTLSTLYPLTFPPDIVKEISKYLLEDILPWVPWSLVQYMVESAGAMITEIEFTQGFYQAL